MRDPDNWAEAHKNRDSWGTKNYKPDMDFTHCLQSEIDDEYGTVEEIYNAICYYDLKLESSLLQNSLQMLKTIQKGISNDRFEQTCFPHKLDDHHGMRKPATPIQIANKVHSTLDWIRATRKRKWDTRDMNPMRQILDYSIKGLQLNSATHLHYDESAER